MNEYPDWKNLTHREFAQLGWNQLAYVKPIGPAGEKAWSVHAADGTEIAVFDNRDGAFAHAMENDIAPVSVH